MEPKYLEITTIEKRKTLELYSQSSHNISHPIRVPLDRTRIVIDDVQYIVSRITWILDGEGDWLVNVLVRKESLP